MLTSEAVRNIIGAISACIFTASASTAFAQTRGCIKQMLADRQSTLGLVSSDAEDLLEELSRKVGVAKGMTLVPCQEFTGKVVASYPRDDKEIPEDEYIVYSTEWVDEVIGDDRTQIIFIFAHEAGHFLGRHFTSKRNKSIKEKESEADRFGACAVARLEGSWDELEGLIKRIRKIHDDRYPNREEALEIARESFQECGGKILGGKSISATEGADDTDESGEIASTSLLGITVVELNEDLRKKFEIVKDVSGIVITKVALNSHAAERGLVAGEVITEIAMESVSSPQVAKDLIGAIKQQGRKRALLMVASKTGELRFVTLRLD